MRSRKFGFAYRAIFIGIHFGEMGLDPGAHIGNVNLTIAVRIHFRKTGGGTSHSFRLGDCAAGVRVHFHGALARRCNATAVAAKISAVPPLHIINFFITSSFLFLQRGCRADLDMGMICRNDMAGQ